MAELADHRALLQRVEEVVDRIQEGDEDTVTVHLAADEIIDRLRDELGIYRGRLYERDGDAYELRATFPEPHAIDGAIRIPITYPPLESCLMRGTIYMRPDDPRVDRDLEAELGVEEFAAIEVGNERYVLGFSVAPGYEPEQILSSLGVVRHAINQKIRQSHIDDIFRQARQIQLSILPDGAPGFAPFDIAGRTEALESMGGDLYDFIPITDKILGLVIADASGHGLPAALQVRDIYTGLRMGLSRDFKIVRTMERLNGIIHRSTLTSRFVSLFYGELERNGTFLCVNAGHPPPFHLAADGEVRFLDQGGPVLGPLPGATYDRNHVQMEPGDLLVLYTDGITEAPSFERPDGLPQEFEVERLVEVVKENRHLPASKIVDAIFERFEKWNDNMPPADDRTVVVVVYPR